MTMVMVQLGLMAFSITTSLAGEVMSHFYLYKKDSYKRLKGNVLRVAAEWEKQSRIASAASGDGAATKAGRAEKRLQKELRGMTSELVMMRMRVMIVFSLAMMVLVWGLNSWCKGVVAAKLPFEPFAALHPLTHRGLEGDDFTDCSVAFYFMLCSATARAFIQKYVGEQLPREVESIGNLAELQESLKAFEERM
mmetsp:Transcript_46248/g.144653  ORF Transcript_46248/g.144653 Transcript_46248/m.144653 type:complete len:194 (-) Transcript_46248:82-663(-)|eukprot:CAMPEP_0118861964 /NCGR_PEP_ID=MMETSP1163-20130328/7323_1 /TAXON_ID=124430 /ORGANISM="Phaeomonas parva, Strain CCMP2877" /LENGTH=193 /DNA_ID=CAMNT_0006795817 /DNA_START=123 /DNA_END=704 /DNA_ORIENTATION=+